jgi:hypothetical protein
MTNHSRNHRQANSDGKPQIRPPPSKKARPAQGHAGPRCVSADKAAAWNSACALDSAACRKVGLDEGQRPPLPRAVVLACCGLDLGGDQLFYGAAAQKTAGLALGGHDVGAALTLNCGVLGP